MATTKKTKSHKTLLDIVSRYLANDYDVQKYLHNYYRNRTRLIEHMVEEMLNEIKELEEDREK